CVSLCFHLISLYCFVSFFLLFPLPPISSLFPYTTLFRSYFRDIGRMVLAAEGRKANDSHADCYQYFCVPEYGTANDRLHFHAVQIGRAVQQECPRPISYAVFCLKKKNDFESEF